MVKLITDLNPIGSVADGDLFELTDVSASNASAKATRAQIVAGLASTANPTFTGTVTVPDGAFTIAKTSGLQAAIDAKAPTANPTFTGTITVPDGALAIADISGLQAELDAAIDSSGAAVAAATYINGLSGTHDATTAFLGNNTFGPVNPVQVSSGEITAGSVTALRSYSPADIKSFVTTHAPGAATTLPWATATGSMAAAASLGAWTLTGNVTAVPVTNGWLAKFRNISGSNKTITPASGVCRIVESGATAASVTIASGKACSYHADGGTEVLIEGDVV